MNFSKYKTYSMVDDKPVVFKDSVGWLVYWKGYLMPAEMALIMCSMHFWKSHPSKEVKRVANKLCVEYSKYDWFLSECPVPSINTAVILANKPYILLNSNDIDYMYYYNYTLNTVGAFDTKYSHEEVYAWFTSMLTNKV